MPEIPLCVYCNQAVMLNDQDYVILNRRELQSADWEYAHAACQAAHDQAHSEEPEDFAVPA